MMLELRHGIAVDPQHIVSATITGSYPDKQLIVQMSTGNEFVIGTYNNPDFSADTLYQRIISAKADALNLLDLKPVVATELPMTAGDVRLLSSVVERAKDWAEVMSDKDCRDVHLEKIEQCRKALASLRKFMRTRTK